MLSQKAKYGLKALLALAQEDDKRPILISRLAQRESIPEKFLEFILLQLRNHGLVRSKKGRGGGYSLLRSPGAITFGEVIRVLDGPLAPVPCASVTAYVPCADCGNEDACGVRLAMKQVRDATASILDDMTLAEVVGQTRRRRQTGLACKT